MLINANTKIATVLKQHPDALEAIVSISPSFNKLRNPILRKLMAGRTSLLMASKVGGCRVEDFFEKLRPLGFVAEIAAVEETTQQHVSQPTFISNITPAQLVSLDVRPVIERGDDPFTIIMNKIKTLQPGMVLKLINSFEPAPLIEILQKKGFEYYVENIHTNEVITYFHKTGNQQTQLNEEPTSSEDWDSMFKNFEGKSISIDVRHLEMPGPMMTILESLNDLPAGYALFVNHKRIPVFLLPELKERNFDYRIKTISEGEVNLLIFKS